jgi:hypothetical protein
MEATGKVRRMQVDVDVNKGKQQKGERKVHACGSQLVTGSHMSEEHDITPFLGLKGGRVVRWNGSVQRVVGGGQLRRDRLCYGAEGVGFVAVPLVVAGSSTHLTALEVATLCFAMTVVVKQTQRASASSRGDLRPGKKEGIE